MSWLKSWPLNWLFDNLNLCSAWGIVLSQLHAPTILVCLITCVVDTGRASSVCFDLSCSSRAFSNFALVIKVCYSPLSGIVLLCAIMAVTKRLVTLFEISYSLSAFTESFSMPKPPSRMGSANNPFSQGDSVSPNIAGKKVFIMMSSSGFISSFVPSIIPKKYINLCCSPWI